jgi:hypothetical protein
VLDFINYPKSNYGFQYLQHHQFVIWIDHQSLLHLTQQRVSSKLQHKALMKLMDLDFSIVYKQGASNKAVGERLC